MTKNILYIGRFQPFHKGHADAIAQIFEHYKNSGLVKLFLGIGSAENNFEEKNPLTAGERFEILESAMKEIKINPENFAIIPVRNINHYALWPHHVQQYMPKIDVLASGSPLVQNLWKTAFPHSEIFSLHEREKISASIIRAKFLEDTLECQKFLTKNLLPSTQKILENFDFTARLQKMKTAY